MSSSEKVHVAYSFVKVRIKTARTPQSWYAEKIGETIEVRKVTYTDDYGNITGWSYELPSKAFEPKYILSRFDVDEITPLQQSIEKASGHRLS